MSPSASRRRPRRAPLALRTASVAALCAAGAVAPSAAHAVPGPTTVVESTVSATCLRDGAVAAPPLTATLRLSVPSSVEPGDEVFVSATGEFTLSAATASELYHPNGPVYLVGPGIRVVATGTAVPEVRFSAATSTRRPDATPGPYPVSIAERPPVSLGVVDADATSVDLTNGAMSMEIQGLGTSPIDGMGWSVYRNYSCTAPTAVLASIPVRPAQPEEPEEPATIDRGYDLAGSATLKTLARGTVGLTGSFATTQTTATDAITGDLRLADATANLVAFGFLPVSARLRFAPTTPTTGSLAGGALTTNSKVRIKLPSVRIFGIELAGGSTCQARQVSNIALTSPAFDPAIGGTLTGSFAISDLAGCGALTGIVSPLTAGATNALALRLTPQV